MPLNTIRSTPVNYISSKLYIIHTISLTVPYIRELLYRTFFVFWGPCCSSPFPSTAFSSPSWKKKTFRIWYHLRYHWDKEWYTKAKKQKTITTTTTKQEHVIFWKLLNMDITKQDLNQKKEFSCGQSFWGF